MSFYNYLKQFQRKHNVIVLEWKQEEKKVYLLINEEGTLYKLLLLPPREYKLVYQPNNLAKGTFLITFTYKDEVWGSYLFIGDGYYHESKKRYVAILWLYGNSKWC